MADDLTALEGALGYTFSDPGLLRLALTHRSHPFEAEGGESNERLEFLGDAVLGLVVADELFRQFDLPEGAMAKTRAEVVDTVSLARVAASLDLGEYLILGPGEDASEGRQKVSILADAMEAVLAAIYVDGGLEPARALILSRWADLITERAAAPGVLDYKTRLQEVLAVDGRLAEYQVDGSGPDHERVFAAEVRCGGDVLGSGRGTSKKRAEQEAARAALLVLGADA
ncbi:MAG: ribonuclease III [Acidimicrobiia bacterium]|nr:ribonuclease III [Acidimicrobiia bacterium]